MTNVFENLILVQRHEMTFFRELKSKKIHPSFENHQRIKIATTNIHSFSFNYLVICNFFLVNKKLKVRQSKHTFDYCGQEES